MPYATYRFNKIIAAETIRFIVTVAIVVYKGLKLVVYRMLTAIPHLNKELFHNLPIGIPPFAEQQRIAERITELSQLLK